MHFASFPSSLFYPNPNILSIPYTMTIDLQVAFSEVSLDPRLTLPTKKKLSKNFQESYGTPFSAKSSAGLNIGVFKRLLVCVR